MPPTAGAYPILGVGKMANVTIASPGEVWSRFRANGVVIPGAAVVPVVVSGAYRLKQLIAGDTPSIEQVAVAMRQVEIPDINTSFSALGPNEIVNQAIADGDYVRTYHTGVLHFSLVEPRADYAPGQKIGWAPAAARPSGKASGTGAWSNAGILAGTTLFELQEIRGFGAGNEKLLTCRFLRSNQF